jgi:hypothetical protein
MRRVSSQSVCKTARRGTELLFCLPLSFYEAVRERLMSRRIRNQMQKSLA